MEATVRQNRVAKVDGRQAPAAGTRVAVAVLCLAGGVLPLAARSIPAGGVRLVYGAALAVAFLAVTLWMRRSARFEAHWPLAFAFFVFALVQVLNNSLPAYFNDLVLHQPPVEGDPLASTASGSVVIQLLDTAIAIVPILVLIKLSRQSLTSMYMGPGRFGPQVIVAVVAFVALYVVATTVPLHRLFPMHGAMSLGRALPLTPALLALVVSNGFQEEFLFRGLFLKRFESALGVYSANLVQAMVFAFAHVGVTYTPSALIFVLIIVFPLGLASGYLMRSSRGFLAPVVFHAGVDIPIYLAFLSYVA